MIITSWSPSRLTDYNQCPLMCLYKHVYKLCPSCFKGKLKGGYDKPAVCDTCKVEQPIPEPLVKGTKVHKMIENYIQGDTDTVPDEITMVSKWVREFRKARVKKRVKVELSLALDRAWKPVEWFDKDAWLRVKLDLLYLRNVKTWDVIDWKTGKFKPDGEYSDQLNIYSTAVLSAFPTPNTVHASLVFTDVGQSVARPEGTVDRKKLPLAQKRWEQKVQALMNDEEFPPRPGNYCRWCDYSKAKGGPCRY